jgi:hypothetical protein
MTKTTIVVRCLRVAWGGLLMTGMLFLFAAGAYGQGNQCIEGKINSQDCWVGLQVSNDSVTVTPSTVALLSGTKLLWKRTDTPPDFAVNFVDCTPFGGILRFDQSSPAAAADQLQSVDFRLCRYKVTLGTLSIDPHVIVIGGSKQHHGSWGRRHLGEW